MIKLPLFKAEFGRNHCNGGFISNSNWLFKIDWILGLPVKKSLGMIALRNGVLKVNAKAILATIAGEKPGGTDLGPFVKTIHNGTPVDLAEGKLVQYRDSHAVKKVALRLPGDVFLAGQYAACLFFDPAAKIDISGPRGVVRIESGGETVGLLMPIKIDARDIVVD